MSDSDQPPAPFKIENHAPNYGAQGIFYGPVSISQNQSAVLRASFCSINSIKHHYLNLGIYEEATFPYISEFIQREYDEAAEFLRKASESGDSLLILGQANAGKTRLAVEALRSALSNWTVLLWNSQYRLDDPRYSDLPPEQVLSKRNIVIFVDDLQQYVSQKEAKSEELLDAYPPSETLRKMIQIVKKNAAKVILVATCRSIDEERTREEFPEFFKNFTTISIRPFPTSQHDSLAIQIIKRFGEKGARSLQEWDGTLGSLILGLRKQHDLYLDLKPQLHSVRVLWAMKLLTLANITDYTEKRVRAVCADVFKEDDLQNDNSIWDVALTELKRIGFVDPLVTKDSEGNTETRLIIRKDIYFERVITGYPDTSDIQSHFDLLKMTLTTLQDAFGLLNLGVTYTDKKEYVQAKETLQAALVFEQAMPLGWINLGIAHFHLQEIEQSLEAFKQSVRWDDTSARAWYNKGFLHLVKEEYEKSLEASQVALTCDPSWVLSYYNQSLALLKIGKYSEALTAINQVLASDPRSPRALANKALVFIYMQENEEAMKFLDQALNEDSSLVNAWNNKGWILFNEGRFQEALIAYKKALDNEPSNSEAMFGKVYALNKLLRYNEALETCGELLSLRIPSGEKEVYTKAWNEKAYIFSDQGQYDQALECIDRAIELSPDNGEMWHSKGEFYYDQKKYMEALEAFKQALSLSPKDDKFRYCIADTLYHLKQYKQALLELESIKDSVYDRNISLLKEKILSVREKNSSLMEETRED